jgi:(+)-trans-carveol dehydrogenase
LCGPPDAQGAPAASEADLAETVALVEKQDRRIVAAKADARDFDAISRRRKFPVDAGMSIK